MRVDNRMLRPPVARGFVVKNVDAVGPSSARLGYVMHFSLGRRLHARLFAPLEKYSARAHTLRQSHTTRKLQS